ncbi:MAG: M48 family metalloprotease [Anaerolineae bacterium]|nr:M48 family metalloprotease [Anaerolineae bacterium]
MIRRSNSSGGLGIRLIIGLVIAVISVLSYLGSQTYNPVVGENQHLSLTPEQEIALGLQSAPEMVQEFGGVDPDSNAQATVDAIGAKLVNSSKAKDTPWQFEFTVLGDPETINAFALPGGPVFITEALLSRLQTEDQIAGVLSHEIVHVLARHSAQQIAKSDLTNGLLGAVSVASGDASTTQTAAMVAQLVNMKYGRDDETQADTIGICLMIDAQYDPNAMVEVMQILEQASGGSQQPEWFSTHPSPQNRIQNIKQAIAEASTKCPL